ncbi:hypothetical protein CsSME_00008728 [Camellia sinensis var. sinensis]
MRVAMVQDETTKCRDIIGDCVNKQDCNARCIAKHPGSDGVCYPNFIPAYCTCFYYCGPPVPPPLLPPPKRNCNTIIGDCVSKEDCNDRCVAQHPGGEGSSYPFKPSYFTCYYHCGSPPLFDKNYTTPKMPD